MTLPEDVAVVDQEVPEVVPDKAVVVDVGHGVLQGLQEGVLLVLKQAEDDPPHEPGKERENGELGLWDVAFLYGCLDQAQNYSGHQIQVHLTHVRHGIIIWSCCYI